MRLVARAFACGDHGEAAGARPIDMLTNERGLIAPRQAVDHTGGLRLAREQRTGDRIRLHVDHHDVLAMGDCAQGVVDAGRWDAGRLDDDLDLGESDQRVGICSHMRATTFERLTQRGRGNRPIVPSGYAKLAQRAGDIEIGDRNDVHPARQPRLRQKHRAELACPDQANGDRTAGGLPFEQHGVEIHGILRSLKAIRSLLQTSARAVYLCATNRCAGRR